MKYNYSTEVGRYLVIWITGALNKYIAEVKQEDPLYLKVEEEGPYAYLKGEDFIILEYESNQIQESQEAIQKLLKEHKDKSHPLLSGLKSLGVSDGKLHEILPDINEQQEIL